jgi:hypothetical protein
MTIALQPPPLQIPSAFGKDKGIATFFSALLNTIYQMWVALYSLQTQSKVTTTDATNTELFNVLIPNNTTVMIIVDVCAHRTGGVSGTLNDSGYYQLIGAYKNTAGVLTGIGSANYIHSADQAGWSISFTSVGTSAIVQVTGAAGNNITWQGTLSTVTAGA